MPTPPCSNRGASDDYGATGQRARSSRGPRGAGAGADLIDLKEPRHGSLGAVDPAVMRDVVRRRWPRAGERRAGRVGRCHNCGGGQYSARHFACQVWTGRLRAQPDWPRRLGTTLAALPDNVGGVAVAYADWKGAAAPAPTAVLEHAARIGCRAVLVDTWHKGARSLLDLWNLHECAAFVARIHEAGLLAVLGGSLTGCAISQLLPLAPNYVAVRGAVCRGGRTSCLSAELVTQLKQIMIDSGVECSPPLLGKSS